MLGLGQSLGPTWVGGSLTPCLPQLPGGTHRGAPDAVPWLCVPAPEGPYACATAGPGPAGGRGEAPLPLSPNSPLPTNDMVSCP